MERTKHIIIILLLFLLLPGSAQANSYRPDIYKAYTNNRMDLWKDVIDKMDQTANKNIPLIAELTNYQYGYIGYCIGLDKKDEARKYLRLAEKNLIVLEKGGYNMSMIKAYKCAFYAYRLGLNKLTAPVNGPKSLENGKEALELDPDNYFALIQYGNIQFYMPEAFGGSKKEGIQYFLRARNIMEKNPSGIKDDWNYMSLLVLIGQSYTYIEDYNAAKSVYDSLLELEPGFLYVKDELYPELLKKMKN